MFEPKDIIGDAVKRVLAILATRNRGEVVGWPEIERTCGFERYTRHWSAFIHRLRRDFLRTERGIKLAAIQSVGLRLMTLAEQVNDTSRQLRARRQLNRGIKELKAVPDAELTDHERQAKHRKIDLARNARRGADYALRVAHKLARPSETGLPRTHPRKKSA